MSALVASRALDRQVAAALGWRIEYVETPGWWIDAGYALVDADGQQLISTCLRREQAEAKYPSFSTDLHAAVDVLLPWLVARCSEVTCGWQLDDAEEYAWTVLTTLRESPTGIAHGESAPTLPLALCAAVLAVAAREKEAMQDG